MLVLLASCAPGMKPAPGTQHPVDPGQARSVFDDIEVDPSQIAELANACRSGEALAFAFLLAQSPPLQKMNMQPVVRVTDDVSSIETAAADYADFPLEARDWNITRRGTERLPSGPEYLILRAWQTPGRELMLFWFRAIYDNEPVGDAPGTLLRTVGPQGVLVFETDADGCWRLAKDVRGRAARRAFAGRYRSGWQSVEN